MNVREEKQPETVLVHGQSHVVPDLSHHLSDLARARQPSPLKTLAKYLGQPGLLQLAGGMPHPEYFPYHELSAKVLAHDSYETVATSSNSSSFDWFWRMIGLGAESGPRTSNILVPKYAASRDDVQLAVALQYGTAMGITSLQQFIGEFSRKVFKPYLPTTTTVITTGNTDAWNRAVETLCNPGDGLLVEEWTYPLAFFTSRPHGVRSVAIAMDGEGMRADALEIILSGWDEKARGFRRPRVMYLVPIGQNPSGATMGVQRKQDIYAICVKYDIIIVEDDPYYFLQEGPYVPESYRSRTSPAMDPEEWVDSLSPSFLKFDYEGRVIRLDTFSKTIAPGSRVGWITASPLFTDRMLRVGEVSTQGPSGFAQAMIAELLVNHWGFDKYVRWVRGLQKQYTDRRDLLIDCIGREFDISEGTPDPSFLSGAKVLSAREKRPSWDSYAYADEKAKDTWFSFIPPTSGMFVWIRVHLTAHPTQGRPEEPPMSTEERLFTMIAEHNLLVGPGWMFTTKNEEETLLEESEFSGDPTVNELLRRGSVGSPSGDPADHDPSQYAHFRLSFSSASEEEMRKAMKIFSTVLRKFFHEA